MFGFLPRGVGLLGICVLLVLPICRLIERLSNAICTIWTFDSRLEGSSWECSEKGGEIDLVLGI